MNKDYNETMMFNISNEEGIKSREVILKVFEALKEKGYDPINQIIGYILSGDPTYITSHNDARSLIRKFERDELLEEILETYLESHQQ